MFWNYDLDAMVPEDHVLRTCHERLLVKEAAEERERWKKSLGREGYGAETGLRALFLQFWGGYSDREMEEQLRYNFVYRWFCGFTLESQTPDHTFFCRVRRAMGPENVSVMLKAMVEDAQLRRIMKKIETFVDASAVRRKEAEWTKRDKEKEKHDREIHEALDEGRREAGPEKKVERKANSPEEIKKFSADTEARWGGKGQKGKEKFWFGYKRHVAVDTSSGMIERVLVTPANINDALMFPQLCPWNRRIIADRGYDTWVVRGTMRTKGCIDRVMRLTKRKDFDAGRNKFISRRRAPWEMVFAHMDRRTRYMGVRKTHLQALMEAIVYNMRRLIKHEGLNPPVIGLA